MSSLDITTRRRFLAAAAATGALVRPSDRTAAAEPPAAPARFKKAVILGMVKGDMPVMDKFRLLKDLGFDGVEIEAHKGLNPEEVVRARDATGLVVHGVVAGVLWKQQLSSNDGAVRAKAVELLKGAVDEAKAYGATTVLTIPGVVNKETFYADAYRRSLEEIPKAIPHAARAGVKLALENVWNQFLLSPLEAARFLDELNAPEVGWYFDAGNVVRCGWPEHWIAVLGRRILKVHIKEYSRKKQQEEGLWKGFDVELGEGDCDWPTVMKALRDVGYAGWITAEVPGGDRARLADIARRMDQIIAS